MTMQSASLTFKRLNADCWRRFHLPAALLPQCNGRALVSEPTIYALWQYSLNRELLSEFDHSVGGQPVEIGGVGRCPGQ